jgi:5-formyltetrahydrofolate cyclo-ligase
VPAKETLRQEMSARRLALSIEERGAKSQSICARVARLVARAGTTNVALYAAIRAEVDLAALDRALRAAGAKVAYPRVDPPRDLTFHAVAAEELVPSGRFAIPEPLPDSPMVLPEALDLIVVPGLAFDRDGRRVGWGAGYYDALLPKAPQALRIGVCFSFQLVSRCPAGEGDERVHRVVTDLEEITPPAIQEETP